MKYISLDIESNGTKIDGGRIWMLSITRGKKTELIEDCFGISKLRPDVKRELEDENICKIIHAAVGVDLPFLEFHFGCKVRNIWDTAVNEVVIQGMLVAFKKTDKGLSDWQLSQLQKHSSKLEYTLPRYGFPIHDKELVMEFVAREPGIPFRAALKEYGKSDTKFLGPLQEMQEYLLKRDGLMEVALLENKTAEKLGSMRALGIRVDQKLWKQYADMHLKEFNKRMKKLPSGINWNSPPQVKGFFKDRGIQMNEFSEMYDLYLDTHDKMLGHFIHAREMHKAVTSYGHNWFDEGFFDSDGRVRCHVTQCINTGRMAMAQPNLQQLPGEDGKKIPKLRRVLKMIAGDVFSWPHRKAFIPDPGKVFVSGDFSGQEMGIMAAASNEKILINAMLRGDDVHALTARLIEPLRWDKGAKKGCCFPKKCKCPTHIEMREPAKIDNFMLAYGGSWVKLVEALGRDLISDEQAKIFVGAHKRVTPSLTRYLHRNGEDAVKTGVSFSADPYRRRRVLRGEEVWQIRNQGKNNPIQSAGANMLKLAMISLSDDLPIVLVIHDQIILEVPKAKAIKAQRELKAIMEKSADYITGIKGLIKVNPTIQYDITKQ